MGNEREAKLQARLFELIDLIYSAVGDVALWSVVLDRLSDAVGGREAMLFPSGHESAAADVASVARMDPRVLVPYAQYYATVNPFSERCDAMYPTGTVRYGHRAVPDAEFKRTEFYSDYFHPNGMHYSFGVKIPVNGTPPMYLAVMRPEPKGGFEDAEGNVLELLMPHLQRALRLHLQFAQLSANANGLERALDALGHAVFGVNEEGRVVLANARAEKVGQAATGLRLVRGRLAANDPAENRRLKWLLQDAAAAGKGGSVAAGGSVLVGRGAGRLPLSVSVTPFHWHPLLLSYGAVAALVFVTDPEERTQTRAGRLRELYGLTPAEARIADALARGMEVKAIAEESRLTQATVRFYLKSIFRKTGMRRQSELVRLVLALPAG